MKFSLAAMDFRMKNYFKILVGLLVLYAGETHALDVSQTRFDLYCKHDGVETVIQFKSASGDITENDMSISILEKNVPVKLPIEPGWFHVTTHQSKIPSACDLKDQRDVSYPAFYIDNTTLAVFLVRDGRPESLYLELALIDTKMHRLLDFKRLGQMKTAFPVIQPYRDGYKLRIVKETDAAYCDCAEALSEAWKMVSIKENKISSAWLEN